MSESEYKELIEFLGKQFESIHSRFDNTPTKDEMRAEIKTAVDDAKEETMRHTGVLIEAVNHRLDILAEGIAGNSESIERYKKENEQEHARLEKMALINSADISKLDQRVGRLEGKA